MATRNTMINYAISLGVQERDGLWKISFVNPLESTAVQFAYLVMDPTDLRVGSKVDGIYVAEPGDRMKTVLSWLYAGINKYPYYWPWEGTFVDKYGYDFEIQKSGDRIQVVEATAIAYEIIKNEIEVKPEDPNDRVVEVAEILEPGGAYVKFTVTLNQPSPTSEVTISPFAPYPLEVVSIMYEEDIETYHPRKELIFKEKPTSSTSSMTFSFSPVIAKRFTIILRQKNYTKNTYLIRGKEIEKNALWDKIATREAEVTLDLTDNVETVEEDKITNWTGWDLYLLAQQKYYDDLAEWEKNLKEYNYYQQKLKEKRVAEEKYEQERTAYRAEYRRATQKYEEALRAYNTKAAQYEQAKKSYDENMKLYNKELAALKEWENKWG